MRQMLWLFVALLLAGCAGNQDDRTPTVALTPEPAQLRVQNNSATAIDELVVLFPEERISFGKIGAGETTAYKPTQKGVYRYAALEISIAGQTQRYPVIDWMGERAETQGTYTLPLGPNLNQPQAWVTPSP